MDMMRRIETLKKANEEHRERLAQLTGKREQLLSQLKREFDVDSLEAAEAKLEKLRKSVSRREAAIRAQLDELEAAVNGH